MLLSSMYPQPAVARPGYCGYNASTSGRAPVTGMALPTTPMPLQEMTTRAIGESSSAHPVTGISPATVAPSVGVSNDPNGRVEAGNMPAIR